MQVSTGDCCSTCMCTHVCLVAFVSGLSSTWPSDTGMLKQNQSTKTSVGRKVCGWCSIHPYMVCQPSIRPNQGHWGPLEYTGQQAGTDPGHAPSPTDRPLTPGGSLGFPVNQQFMFLDGGRTLVDHTVCRWHNRNINYETHTSWLAPSCRCHSLNTFIHSVQSVMKSLYTDSLISGSPCSAQGMNVLGFFWKQKGFRLLWK